MRKTISLDESAAPWTAADDLRCEGSGRGYAVISERPDGATVRVRTFSTGSVTNLGRYSLVTHQFVDEAQLTVTNGCFALKGPGDIELHGTYAGHTSPDRRPGVHGITAAGPITHSTGPLTDLNGRLQLELIADFATGEHTERFTIALSTPAEHADRVVPTPDDVFANPLQPPETLTVGRTSRTL